MNPLKNLDLPRFLTQKRWVLPLLGVVAVICVAYTVAMHYLLPYPDIKRWVETQFRTAGVDAKLDGFGPGPLFGLQAQSILLTPVGTPERRTEFRDVRVSLSFLSMLMFQPAVSLSADAMGGTLDARWSLGKHRDLKMRWTGVDLGKAPISPDVAALGLRGRSTGSLEASLPSPDAPGSRLSGSLDATVTDAKLGPGSMNGFPLPGVTLGGGQFHLTAKQGRVNVQAARFEGGDLDAYFSGTVDLPPDGSPGAVDGTLTLRPRGRAVEDLGFLLAFLPGGRGSDGAYTSHVGGRVGSLVLSPASAKP